MAMADTQGPRHQKLRDKADLAPPEQGDTDIDCRSKVDATPLTL